MRLFVAGFFIFCFIPVFSQVSAPEINIYAGGAASAGESKPFWNVNNQFGKYSLDNHEGIAGIRFSSRDTSGSLIHFDYGLEAYQRIGRHAESVLHQGYAAIRTPLLSIRAGMKEETIGNQDSVFSLGGTVWSSNARPMPKIVIETPGYVDVPFTKGYVEVNGSLAHGWFEKDRFVKDVYLHQKHLHVRFGGDFFLNASLGLIHFAQWGGVSPNPRFLELPSDFEAYKKIFLVQQGDPGTVDTSEIINSLGNHLGARNYRLDYKNEQFIASFYFQTIFEDNSGLSKPFYEDGIRGLSFRFKKKDQVVNHIVLEYLKTTFQSGPVHDIFTDSVKLKGDDNYFNHYIYTDGWSYNGMTIGTPLLTSPVYDSTFRGIRNNRVFAVHLGLSGIVQNIQYKTYFTYSTNEGTFKYPFESKRRQFSWYLETTIPTGIYDIDLDVKLAADIGEMYGNSIGAIVLLKRSF